MRQLRKCRHLGNLNTNVRLRTPIVLMGKIATRRARSERVSLIIFNNHQTITIIATKVVNLTMVTAPRDMTINAMLILTITRNTSIMLLNRVIRYINIRAPDAREAKVMSRGLFRLLGNSVSRLLPLLGNVNANMKGIKGPIPKVTTFPLRASFFNRKLRSLVPRASLVPIAERYLWNFLMRKIGRHVVFRRRYATRIMTLRRLSFLVSRLVGIVNRTQTELRASRGVGSISCFTFRMILLGRGFGWGHCDFHWRYTG